MRIQAVLNENVTKLWLSVAERPEFEGSTTAVIVNRLLIAYLNPQVVGHVAPSKPSKPEEPKLGKVEQRHQAEQDVRAARYKVQNDLYRASGVWPKPLGLVDGREAWVFPDGSVSSYTPPDDYLGAIAPIDDDGARAGAWIREREAEKQAYIANGGVVEVLKKVTYTPTRPIREEYDTEDEWLVELEMFDADIEK